MADQAVAEKVQEMFDKLLGDKAEAEAFADSPEDWLDDNGYADLPPDAVAECGVQYGSGASAVASSGGGGYAPGAAGVAQAAAPSVYNTYINDQSITNNIANNGVLDFDQQVIQGDGNVAAGGDLTNTGQIQTGDGQQAGDGGVNVGDDVEDSQIQTGDGIQAGDDVDITGSNIETGEGDLDQSTNIDDHSTTTTTNVDDHSVDVDDHSTNVETNVESDVGLL
jgi:hypothetical protein